MTDQLDPSRAGATPFWFGPDDRPLFGWLHLPADGAVRGGVVLCQPLGIEATCVYFSYRQLANRLAELGLAVLRFDYDGTGDSSGAETDPDRLEAWLSSVTTATDLLVELGVGSVGLVGIRMGGLFAAHEAARRGGVDVLALWDPCISGKAFLREQRFLRTLSGDKERRDDEAVEAPGLRFEPETVKAFGDFDLGRSGVLARRTLVLVPPDVSRPRALERRLEGEDVEWQEATGQAALMDSQRQDPPYETLERVAAWLSDAFTGEPVPVVAPHRPSAEVARNQAGQRIVESTLELGDIGLFGIVTEGPDVGGRPTIVLVNEGGTHHIGQARVWVEVARQLASYGFRVLRFDLSGNGDSDARPGQQAHVARAPEAVEDVSMAIRGVSSEDPSDVVVVGFCSGAYVVVEEALRQKLRGMCIINPSFAFDPPEPAGTAARPARQVPKRWFVDLVNPVLRSVARRRRSAEIGRWIKAVEIGSWPAALSVRHPGVPEPVWQMVNRYMFENTGMASLERAVGTGVDTLLICGSVDLVPISLGNEQRLQALRQAANFRLVELEELEHSSWEMEQRLAMVAIIIDHIITTFDQDRDPSRLLPA